MNRTIKNITLIAEREIKLILENISVLFLNVFAPGIGMFLLWWIFSAGVVKDLPIAVVNNDNTALSNKVLQMVDATSTVNIDYTVRSLQEADKLMKQGKIYAFIVIPKDLESGIINESSPTISVFLNGSNIVTDGLIKSALKKTLTSIKTGIKIQISQKHGYTRKQAFVKAMPIMYDNHIIFNPYLNYSYFLLMGLIPLMVVVAIFLGSVYSYGIELKNGTGVSLLRQADNNILVAVIGKSIPYWVINIFNLKIAGFILFYIMGITIKSNVFMLLVAGLLLITSYQSMALIFVTITSNLRLSLSLGSAYTMMAVTFSGLTFPIDAMPLFAKHISYLFPFGFWLKIFNGLALRDLNISSLALQFTILILYSLIGFAFINQLKRRYLKRNKWGKI